jgi:hypothetical protein
MPRSITAPQTGSMVWYFSGPGVPPQAAIVTQTIDAAHFNLYVLSQVGVPTAILDVLFSLVGQGAGQSVASAAVAAGGASYAANDLITLANGVVIKVLTVTTGAVTTLQVVNGGQVNTPPANPQAQVSTTGAGTGATFNLTWTTAYCTYMRVNEFLSGSAPDGVFAAQEMATYNDWVAKGMPKIEPEGKTEPPEPEPAPEQEPPPPAHRSPRGEHRTTHR